MALGTFITSVITIWFNYLGFLYHFEEEEIEILNKTVFSTSDTVLKLRSQLLRMVLFKGKACGLSV